MGAVTYMANLTNRILSISALLMLSTAAVLALLIASCTGEDETAQPVTPTRTALPTPIATPTPTTTFTPTFVPTPTQTPATTPTPAPTVPQKLSDRDVLVSLYEATDGPNWKDNANWLSDLSLGEWYGVTTNSNGRVTAISLPDNQLTGEIPAELGNLSELTSLVLYHNQLVGTIPTQLTELSSLHELYLSGTLLGGTQLHGCVPMNLLSVAYNDMSMLRMPFCEPLHIILAAERDVLTVLYESTNGPNWKNNTNWLSDKPVDQWFGVTPDEAGRVTELRLNDNGLSGKLPIELDNLHNLELIYVGGNLLCGCVPIRLSHVPSKIVPFALVSPNHVIFYCRTDEEHTSLDSQALLALY